MDYECRPMEEKVLQFLPVIQTTLIYVILWFGEALKIIVIELTNLLEKVRDQYFK